jgi:hypothetical protein
MRFRLQLITISDDGSERIHLVAELARGCELRPETTGLTLAEGKQILEQVQQVVIDEQVQTCMAQHRHCAICGELLSHKGHHQIKLRTVFGKLQIRSPRLRRCPCSDGKGTKSFSPLARVLPERSTPERLYLETLFASLLSYDTTTKLLTELLPLEEQLNAMTIRNHLLAVAKRSEAELGTEQVSFIEGCPRDWAKMPIPNGPLTVGIDGGFVRAQQGEGWFEVIAGKSVLQFRRGEAGENKSSKCFGFVQTYDDRPKRRLFELLKSQGMQENQQVVFLSDGGEDVRNLQLYLNPQAEHLLDWFHITMRLTVLRQQALGLNAKEILETIERIKHCLWHGNVFQALQHIEFLQMDLDCIEDRTAKLEKLEQGVADFLAYIQNNRAYIPNYDERYRHNETISTGFVESTVNQVVSKRFVKKQQMQWTPRGAHLLLQTRTKVLNGDLEQTFRRWYPAFRHEPEGLAA